MRPGMVGTQLLFEEVEEVKSVMRVSALSSSQDTSNTVYPKNST